MICIKSIRFVAVTLLMCESFAFAEEDRSKHTAFFESKIRPALVKHCYECHSIEQNASEGGLTLDTRSGVRKGGDRGPAILPGKPDASLIMTAITHTDPDLVMPPEVAKLPAPVIADIRRWIELGAHDPRPDKHPSGNDGAAANRQSERWADRNEHWAYRAVKDSVPPQTNDPHWTRRSLDSFVLAKLQSASLAPSPDAEPGIILRRIYLDLIGLPPTPSQRQRFLREIDSRDLDAALATAVDQLLAMPEFGERWGRHWLDVARYAESSGKESNLTFPHAWRYRDYVIDSIGADKSYDQFLTEQIAGDLLPAVNDQQRAEHLIATGFLAIGPKSLNEMNPRQFKADLVDEQIDTFTRSLIASSIACARCHDHKSDPFSMEDYYGIAGVFYSTDTRFGSSIGPESQIESGFVHLPSLPNQSVPNKSFSDRELANLVSKVSELKWEKRRRLVQSLLARWFGGTPGEYFSLQDALRIRWSLGGLDAKLKTVDERGRALPLAMGVVDSLSPRSVPLLRRGELSMPGDIVGRELPKLFESRDSHAIPERQSGRLQLAEWLTDPAHPLTARVIVNRVWQHLFGEGIVRTVDNFGSDGEQPSHPELLDHLATKFTDRGWSIKSLVREVVLSRSYRQSSNFRGDAFAIDPDNRLLWRANKRRLDAEVIRDAILFVANQLQHHRPDASLVAKIGNRPISIIGFDRRVTPDLDGSQHRSVYLPIIRDRLPDAIELFDGAEPSLVTGKRETTNVPLQSLFLMNSVFMQHQSGALAARLVRRPGVRSSRISHLFELCFCRVPHPSERRIAKNYLGESPSEQDWARYSQALLCTAEFRNLD